MTHADDGTNGRTDRICPFYNADMDVEGLKEALHGLKSSIDTHVAALLERVTERDDRVPYRTHILTIVAVIVSLVSIEAAKAILRG